VENRKYLLALFLVSVFALGDIFAPAQASLDAVDAVPVMSSITASKWTLTANETVTLTFTVSDASGASDITRVWVGFQNCTVDIGEGFNSNFERNFANYFGSIVYEVNGNWSIAPAQVNTDAACTGGAFGTSVWGTTPNINAIGSTEITQVIRSLSGNTITYAFTVKLTNHATGVFPIYYMIKDAANNYSAGPSTVAWTKSPYSITVVAPTATPTPTSIPGTVTPIPTPTATPMVNLPPYMNTISISPNPALPGDLVTFSVTFSDPNGANGLAKDLMSSDADIQMFVGVSNCSGDSYQFKAGVTPSSNFEMLFAEFFAIGQRSIVGSMKTHIATGTTSVQKGCTDTVTGDSGPFMTSITSNNWGTASVSLNQLNAGTYDVQWVYKIQLTDFPAGTYNIFYSVADKQGLYQTNTTSPTWSKYAPLQFTVSESNTSDLANINAMRSLSNLNPVTYNTSWDKGAGGHAKYMVKNNLLTHTESSSNPWYTAEGFSSGQSSLVLGSTSAGLSDTKAIEKWMSGPFHTLSIIDPRLTRVSYGVYREAVSWGNMATGAVLDVRGIDYFAAATYPVFYPANGKTTLMSTYYGGSVPDPLAPCAGFTAPSGAPIIVQFGSGSTPVNLTTSSFKQGTVDLPYCIYTETTYNNAISKDQANGRSILGMHDAVVIMPKNVLTAGQTYNVSMTVNGVTLNWLFTIAAAGGGGSVPSTSILSPITANEVCMVDIQNKLNSFSQPSLRYSAPDKWSLTGVSGEFMSMKSSIRYGPTLDMIKLYYKKADGRPGQVWAVVGIQTPPFFTVHNETDMNDYTRLGHGVLPYYVPFIDGASTHEEMAALFNQQGKYQVSFAVSGSHVSSEGVNWEACLPGGIDYCALPLFFDKLYGDSEIGISNEVINGNVPSHYLYGFLVWPGQIDQNLNICSSGE